MQVYKLTHLLNLNKDKYIIADIVKFSARKCATYMEGVSSARRFSDMGESSGFLG